MSRHLLFAALVLAACSKKKEEPAPTAAPPPAPVAVALDAPAAPPPPDPAPVVDAAEAAAASTSPGTRCTLDGDPLIVPCVGGGSLGTTTKGDVYLTDPEGVHRYHRAEGDGCALTVDAGFGDGGVLAAPVKEPKPQTLGKGPVMMRSGGPDWKVATGGDAAYLYDFLLGLYRIDGGKLVPTCPDLQGARDPIIDGDTATIASDGGQRLALRKKCKVTPMKLDPRPSFGVHAAGGGLWGEAGSGKLVGYDAAGKQVAAIGGEDSFAPGGLCSIAAVTDCAGDVCVLDSNCQKLSRFAADGTHQVERKSSSLIGHAPYGLTGLATAGGDDLYLLATEKDGETCEAALYLVPGAAIAP